MEEQVIFQCNTASCCELADPNPKLAPDEGKSFYPASYIPLHLRDARNDAWLSMGPSHGQDLFGSAYPSIATPGGRQNMIPLLAEYTKRVLSHQSDALDATRAMFSSIVDNSKGKFTSVGICKPSILFWGIPTKLHTYTYGVLDGCAEIFSRAIADLSSDQKLYAAIHTGMLWRCIDDFSSPTARRRGFPSWSWAGWIALSYWINLTHKTIKLWDVRDLPTRMWTHAIESGEVDLTNDMIEKLHQTRTSEASLYTYRLGMQAYVVDVAVLHRRISNGHGVHGFRERYDYAITKEVHWARPDRDSEDGDFDMLVWPVHLTEPMQEGSALHVALCTRTFQCVVMYGHYGLLLLTTEGVSERVGVVKLDAKGNISSKELCQATRDKSIASVRPLTPDIPHSARCLKDQFPGQQRTVLLE
jgi:hypothetical protein